MLLSLASSHTPPPVPLPSTPPLPPPTLASAVACGFFRQPPPPPLPAALLPPPSPPPPLPPTASSPPNSRSPIWNSPRLRSGSSLPLSSMYGTAWVRSRPPRNLTPGGGEEQVVRVSARQKQGQYVFDIRHGKERATTQPGTAAAQGLIVAGEAGITEVGPQATGASLLRHGHDQLTPLSSHKGN